MVLKIFQKEIERQWNFRNHFEHFDERLEEWAKSSERHNFVDSNIGPPNMIDGIDPKDYSYPIIFYNISVSNKIFINWGEMSCERRGKRSFRLLY